MSDFIARYAAARKAAIARDFAKLNPEQRSVRLMKGIISVRND